MTDELCWIASRINAPHIGRRHSITNFKNKVISSSNNNTAFEYSVVNWCNKTNGTKVCEELGAAMFGVKSPRQRHEKLTLRVRYRSTHAFWGTCSKKRDSSETLEVPSTNTSKWVKEEYCSRGRNSAVCSKCQRRERAPLGRAPNARN